MPSLSSCREVRAKCGTLLGKGGGRDARTQTGSAGRRPGAAGGGGGGLAPADAQPAGAGAVGDGQGAGLGAGPGEYRHLVRADGADGGPLAAALPGGWGGGAG